MYKPKHTKTKKQSHLDCLWMICYAKELYSFLIIFNFNNFFHLFLQTASTTDSGTSVFSAIHEAPSIFFSSLHSYAQVVWDSCLSIRLFSRYVLPNGTSVFFWWEHSYRIHIVFREDGKPPCTLSDTRDLDLRGAGQIMHDYPTVPTRHTCYRSICLRVLACKDCVSSVRICSTQAVSATCLALHVLCWEFSSIFTVSCSRNVHSSTFLGFPVSSCLTACPVTHPWKVVICCQNWWKSSGTEADGTSSVTQKFQFHSLNWCVGHQSPT